MNFANPKTPGGGVRYGAISQEEDLCRKSTLLSSLESENARIYYKTHRLMNDHLSSNAILLSENVEVFRDKNNELIDNSFIVSILTCAAPMLRYCDDYPITHKEEYEKMVYDRIFGILSVAIEYGYKQLVLGAWGCGVFMNDAKIIAKTFQDCINEINIKHCAFDNTVFAIYSKSGDNYNLQTFRENFKL